MGIRITLRKFRRIIRARVNYKREGELSPVTDQPKEPIENI